MKHLNEYISEKLTINKNYKSVYCPSNKDELVKYIGDLIIKRRGGTDKNPVNLNNIDLSNLDDLSDVFNRVNDYVKHSNCKMHVIDVSNWDVNNISFFNWYINYDL